MVAASRAVRRIGALGHDALKAQLGRLRVQRRAVLEVLAVDDTKRRRYDRMVYYAFDLLHLDGFDTRAAPLIERKRVLQS